MKLLGIDFETQGLDPQKDRVTETGLVLYDSDTRQPVRISGYLVKAEGGVTAEITKLTGLTNELLAAYGVEPRDALRAIVVMARNADFLVAHNAEFDRGFLEAWCKRDGVDAPKQPWIDTRVDLPLVAYSLGKSASLKYLCCDHDFLYKAHRATSDVLAMFELLSRYDINEVIERAKTPNVQVRAVVSYDDRLLAKERGYYWKPELKLWVKPLKLNMVDLEKQEAPFPVVLMTETAVA